MDVAASVLALAKTDAETKNSKTYEEEMKQSHFSLTNLANGRGAKLITTLPCRATYGCI